MVDLAGDAPSPTDLTEALRRGVIPYDSGNPAPPGFVQGIQQGRLADKWIPMIRALAQLWPTPTDALGIDKAVGTLIDALLTGITGAPPPRNLHDVIADISIRLSQVEGQWAQFFTDGGSQVEQAGNDWKDITSVIGNTAIVAFAVQATVDPDGWAAEIADTLGAAANDLGTRAVTLFGG